MIFNKHWVFQINILWNFLHCVGENYLIYNILIEFLYTVC